MTDLNIILDLDNTLISFINENDPIARPYLGNFLKFVFNKFNQISIWTAVLR